MKQYQYYLSFQIHSNIILCSQECQINIFSYSHDVIFHSSQYEGEIQVLYKVTISPTLTNKKWSGKELPVKAGETLDVIVKAVDNKLVCRNEEGKCEYPLLAIKKITQHMYLRSPDDCFHSLHHNIGSSIHLTSVLTLQLVMFRPATLLWSKFSKHLHICTHAHTEYKERFNYILSVLIIWFSFTVMVISTMILVMVWYSR